MTIYETPIKQPRAPICLCQNFICWILQIVSPSLLFSCQSSEALKYHEAMDEWKFEALEWLVQERKANKQQYREYLILKKQKECEKK